MSRRTIFWTITGFTGLIAILLFVFTMSYFINRNVPRHNLGFREYYPAKNVVGFGFDPSTITVIKDEIPVVLFSLTGSNNQITVSQQLDLKGDVYSAFIVPGQEYQYVNSNFGNIAVSSINVTVPGSLTAQDEPRTIAAARFKTTTVIMRSKKSVSTDDWKAIYNSLQPSCKILVGPICW